MEIDGLPLHRLVQVALTGDAGTRAVWGAIGD